MPKYLELSDLQRAQKKHKFHWKIPDTMPPRKTVGEKATAYFELECVCKTKRWVRWGALSNGLSGSCGCHSKKHRVPTLLEMEALILKHGMLWIPTLLHKTNKKTKRRLFWMSCKCGKRVWVRWGRFQQGGHKGCRSCGIRIGKGTYANEYHSKHPITSAWRNINFRRHFKGYSVLWENFEQFKDWSLANGYGPGAVFRYTWKQKHFTPETCQWYRIVAGFQAKPKGGHI